MLQDIAFKRIFKYLRNLNNEARNIHNSVPAGAACVGLRQD